uniref:Uncharacterized protein n=1 Tax=Nelumbo nucifera TaxID=4432 RepID=A0A822YP51_NELNU|nr:TPA_asm: hypothetical protein HUJ06_012734 [Nelumbo nucifera]
MMKATTLEQAISQQRPISECLPFWTLRREKHIAFNKTSSIISIIKDQDSIINMTKKRKMLLDFSRTRTQEYELFAEA